MNKSLISKGFPFGYLTQAIHNILNKWSFATLFRTLCCNRPKDQPSPLSEKVSYRCKLMEYVDNACYFCPFNSEILKKHSLWVSLGFIQQSILSQMVSVSASARTYQEKTWQIYMIFPVILLKHLFMFC